MKSKYVLLKTTISITIFAGNTSERVLLSQAFNFLSSGPPIWQCNSRRHPSDGRSERWAHCVLKVYIYIQDRGTGATAYNNLWACGESVVRRVNRLLLPRRPPQHRHLLFGGSGSSLNHHHYVELPLRPAYRLFLRR